VGVSEWVGEPGVGVCECASVEWVSVRVWECVCECSRLLVHRLLSAAVLCCAVRPGVGMEVEVPVLDARHVLAIHVRCFTCFVSCACASCVWVSLCPWSEGEKDSGGARGGQHGAKGTEPKASNCTNMERDGQSAD
jgi:hypothetical protein